MATVKRFEDLQVWQNARALRKEVREMAISSGLSTDYVLFNQLMRAALSVMSNISEGFERGTTKDFVNFLHIAKASNGEVRNHLYAAHDDGYLKEDLLNPLIEKSNEISAQLSKFITYLRTSEIKNRTK